MTTTEYMDQVKGWTDGHLAKTAVACEDIRATTSPVKPGWQEATKLLNAVRYEQFAREDDKAFAERAGRCDGCGETDTDESPCGCWDGAGHAIVPTWAIAITPAPPEDETDMAAPIARIEANQAHRQARLGAAYGRLSAALSAALALTLLVGTPGATEAHSASRTRTAARTHARQIVEFNRTRMPEAPRDERPNATYWDVDTFRLGYMAALGTQGIAAETIAALEQLGCAYLEDDASISC